MTARRLDVFLYGDPIGVLDRPDAERPRAFVFAYSPEYVARPGAPALSHALPLRAAPFDDARVRNWFSGLLPEGTARDAIARALRLDALDDFALLVALGGECAGAVELWEPGDRPARAEPEALRELTHADIERWIHERPRAPLEALPSEVRLSLAGAQDKTPVVAGDDGRMFRPRAERPSTHLLKVPSPDYPNIVVREALGLALARSIGLAAVSARVLHVPTECLLVERYDRSRDTAGVNRLHQEDLCQAMGLPPESKYEDHGGPGAAACLRFLRDELRVGARALEAVVRWLAFNVGIGNADAHAKNLSVLRHRDGTIVLAPFYDLVPTGLYRTVGRALAMGIGEAKTIDDVSSRHWEQFAEASGLGREFVRQRTREVAHAAHDGIDAASASLRDAGVPAALLAADCDALRARLAAMRDERPMTEPTGAWAQRGVWG